MTTTTIRYISLHTSETILELEGTDVPAFIPAPQTTIVINKEGEAPVAGVVSGVHLAIEATEENSHHQYVVAVA